MIYPWQNNLWDGFRGKLGGLSHAVLIHGREGIGKLAFAEHLAQALLCEVPDPARVPCGICEGCRWYQAGSHPDFRRVEPEALARRAEVLDEDPEPVVSKGAKPSAEIKVDQVRSLEGFLNLGSHRGGRRVALVRPAESMNANAANALLKGLEEPPGRASFILVSHGPARLLPTIRSRCIAVPMSVPDRASALAWLAAQDVPDPASWLDFASGAPLRALDYAREAGAALLRTRQLLDAGDWSALAAVNDREGLEGLAEVLQKYALDKAFAFYAGRSRYGAGAKAPAAGAAWLRYARQMGRYRALARHPLNPRLFAGEMLRGMPKT
jgi:DNA polymerase III subunit delta'